jgi:hypothetical protein
MRRTLLSLAAASAIVSAAALAPTGASALTAGAGAGVRAAIEDTSLLEDVAWVCRHRWQSSRRHCYWVRPYYRPYRPYAYRPYYRRYRYW